MTHRTLRPFGSLWLALALLFAGVTPALAAPPLNDNFVDAEDITSLPFSGSANNSESTTEFNEPFGCFSPRTIWYRFTPAESGFFTIDMNGSSFFDTVVNVWRQFSHGIGGLNFKGCASFGDSLLLHLEGGTTYYFQAGDNFTGGGDLLLNIQEVPAPQPVADFFFYPSDPSQFDTVTFCDNSFDPGNVGFESMLWDFGDTAASTDNCAQHQYAADGDYSVLHEVTTFDGRTDSISRLVQVRTHDVAIVKITAPISASIGQTRAITISIRNTRYPELVTVALYKSVPGSGFQWVAASDQFIPVRSGNRTSQLTFNYTFTLQDAQAGKVTFKAIAVIYGANDALPADNEAITKPPTAVRR